jgi:STE24 endopeptidase
MTTAAETRHHRGQRHVVRHVRRRGHYGAFRAVAALPAVAGGTLLMLVLTAGLGVWQLLVWLPWVSMPLLLSTRSGERVAVQAAYRFRTLTARQEQQLGPVRTAALDRCGLPLDRFDWYVSPGRQPNACVAGRRSIAVTDGALQSFLAGRLPADLLAAVLVHELGHHATRASRCRLGAAWLAAPGRFAFGLIMRLSIGLCGGRRPGPVTALLALIAMGMALTRLVQDQQWLPAAMGIGLAAAFVLTPLLDAAVSRASEHAADRYAHAVGAGPDLSRALTVLDPSSHRPSRWPRPLDRHPPVARRVDRLTGWASADLHQLPAMRETSVVGSEGRPHRTAREGHRLVPQRDHEHHDHRQRERHE